MNPGVRAGLGIAAIVVAAFVAGFYYFERVLEIKYWMSTRPLALWYKRLASRADPPGPSFGGVFADLSALYGGSGRADYQFPDRLTNSNDYGPGVRLRSSFPG